MQINVKLIPTESEHQLKVFDVTISGDDGGCWIESIATEELLRVFLRGMRAGMTMHSGSVPLSLTFHKDSHIQQLP